LGKFFSNFLENLSTPNRTIREANSTHYSLSNAVSGRNGLSVGKITRIREAKGTASNKRFCKNNQKGIYYLFSKFAQSTKMHFLIPESGS